MGKLRTSMLNLQKLLVDNPARQEKVEKELEGGDLQRQPHRTDRR